MTVSPIFPITTFPACPMTEAFLKYGISPNGIPTLSVNVSAKSPSPDPKTIAT